MVIEVVSGEAAARSPRPVRSSVVGVLGPVHRFGVSVMHGAVLLVYRVDDSPLVCGVDVDSGYLERGSADVSREHCRVTPGEHCRHAR